jgi:phosphoribosylformimino-5-aminoimidazole carboxamide ribotide isomerase
VRIIPVIDLKGGQVVRGIAGRRSEYRPIQSQLVAGSNPAEIAAAFVRLGLNTLYVADLNAIGDRQHAAPPDWTTYRSLLDAGVSLLADAGLRTDSAATPLADFEHHGAKIDGVIAALETLADIATLERFVRIIGPERLIFSLDLRHGEIITPADAWLGMTPLDCATQALSVGVNRFIVLDLAAVGVHAGVPTLDLCRELRQRAPQAEIISGGGVRGIADLHQLAAAGCDAALVASALHDGRLSPADIAAIETAAIEAIPSHTRATARRQTPE